MLSNMDDVLLAVSPFLPFVSFVIFIFMLVNGALKRNKTQMVASVFAPAAVFLVLQVQIDGLQARKELLERAEVQSDRADSYVEGLQAAAGIDSEIGVATALDLLQLTQDAEAAMTQARIAEVQTRVASQDSLLTTLLVLITLYYAWQTRLAVVQSRAIPQPPLPASTFAPEIVLVVPRRFARVRRWLRPTSESTEQIRVGSGDPRQ